MSIPTGSMNRRAVLGLLRSILNFSERVTWKTHCKVTRGAIQQACFHPCSTSATSNRSLKGKTALVTGSTSGIGLGVARGLASEGCNLVLTGLGDQGLIQGIKSDISKDFNTRVEFIDADFMKARELDGLCKSARKLYPDGIDILVNNAGFQFVSQIEDFPTDKWDALIAVMLTAPYHLIKHLVGPMKKKGYGRIINLSSVHGVRASPNKAGYVSAKHGTIGLTKVVALECAGTGVTCNAVCPGYVDTPILQMQVKTLSEENGITYDEAKGEFLAKFMPSKAPIGIDHIADMCTFLCSDAGSQMTGSVIVMDGGWTAK